MRLNHVQRLLDATLEVGVDLVLRRMQVGLTTRYRTSVRRDLEAVLEGMAAGRAPPLTSAHSRALCLLVRRPFEPEVQPEAVRAYVRALLLDSPPDVLVEAVMATGASELVERFVRWGPTHRRSELREFLVVLTVMAS
jgi:hypothetical protein